MEKVIAYKSFDGKLFSTEEKCLAHEAEKRKYPLIKNKEYRIEGDLGLKLIEERLYSSKNRYTKKKSYYLLPNGWKIYTTQHIEVAYKEQFMNNTCFNLTSFIIQVLNKNKSLTYNKLCEYLKYFYNSKKVIGYTESTNNYGIGEPIYDLETWENSIKKELPDYLRIDLGDWYFAISDKQNHVYLKIFFDKKTSK